jgi:hypothetical protein
MPGCHGGMVSSLPIDKPICEFGRADGETGFCNWPQLALTRLLATSAPSNSEVCARQPVFDLETSDL